MLARQIAYNTITSAGARILGLALSLITIGFITRYLGQEGFGYYATILAFLYFFTVLSDLGLYSISVREISRPKANESKIAGNAFTLRFFFGLFAFSIAPIIVCFLPYPDQIKLGTLIASAAFWLNSNQQVLMGIFQKYLRMDKIALTEVAARSIQLALVIIFIHLDLGFLFIVGALTAGAIINFSLAFIFSQRYILIKFRFDFDYWKSILKESLPLAVASVFTVVYFRLDTIMLSLMQPAKDVGIYNLAYKFLESLIFFPAMFVGLIMPLMSKYAVSDKIKFKQTVQKTLDLLLIFIIPLIIGTWFLSKWLVVLIGGPEFITSAGVLNILIIATGIIFLGVLFSNQIIALKQQKKLAYIYGLGALFNLITNYIFIPQYSYYGAAGTTLFTELLVTVLMVVIIYRSLGALPHFKLAYKYILAGLIMASSFILLSSCPIYWVAPLTVIIYFISLYLMKAFSIQQILSLIRKTKPVL